VPKMQIPLKSLKSSYISPSSKIVKFTRQEISEE
jgi:hypothetical protein